jgi:hypothetical protein
MKQKTDAPQGTLASMFPKAPDVPGPRSRLWHSAAHCADQRCFYRLEREGRKQLQAETQDWQHMAATLGRFFEIKAEDLSCDL